MKPKKKKKKVTAPKRTTLKRPSRLQSAKDWIGTYTGKNITQGYAKHYKVDLLCAIKELRLLGVVISESYEQSVKQTLAALAMQKKLKLEQKEEKIAGLMDHSNDDFAFIIGYTSGGAPYGIRWEDMPPDDDAVD
ncbi:hypothetical protein BH09BAC6_BH09BAC6_36840 [soil metagenome]